MLAALIHPPQIHGRRGSAPSAARRAAMAKFADYEIALPAAPGILEPTSLFSSPPLASCFSRLHLEIGYGDGMHLAALAAAHPQDGFLGTDIYTAGTSNLMKLLLDQDLQNIRLSDQGGLAVLQALASHSIDHIYLLFPDPWPKARHHQRRFIQPHGVAEIARTLKPNGTLLLASDHAELTKWMRDHVMASSVFTLAAETNAPPAGHILTRYAQRGQQAGRTLTYLTFLRINI